MNFKRLELYGFKSFADKTVIDFNEGITGIVGPNGSGKSNFSDAIKWVLGEQSAKALRGKSMQDVIFAGTQRRTQMSYCEVTLVFDNTNQKIFKTLEFDEVSFSRKLYRSGDSEYLLNGTPILLKNMRDIIRDTGLGKDGYSIIGQGRVAEIINSKPENRRAIFEEAAGISKYKKRKDDSEVKLEKTREHLDRLQDIIREIERQLNPLQKKAETAKKYLVLYDKQRSVEVNHYLYAYDNNDKDIDKINEIIKAVSEEIEYITKNISENDSKYFENLEAIRQVEKDLFEYRELRTELLVSNERKHGKGETLQATLNAAKSEEGRLTTSIEKNNSLITERDEIINALVIKKNQILSTLNEIKGEYESKQGELNELIDKINERNLEFDSAERAMMEALEKLSGVKVDITQLQADYNYLSQDKVESEALISELKTNIEDVEEEKQQAEKEINLIHSERDNIYKELNDCKKKLNENKFLLTNAENNINSARGSLSAYEAQQKVLSVAKNQYESYQGSVKRIMQEAKRDSLLNSKIVGVVAELMKVAPKYETAIEVALGGALQNIVTSTIDDVKYCIEVLKRNKMGTITFLPINSMRPRVLSNEQLNVLRETGVEGVASDLIGYNKAYDNVFKNLLGATIICDTYDNANIIAKKYNRAFRIVTLEGEVFSTQGSVTGGSRRQDTLGILGQERELKLVVEKIEKAKALLEQFTNQKEMLSSSVTQLTNLFNDLNEKLVEKEVEYNTATNKQDSILDKLDDLVESLSDESAKYDKICNELNIISTKLSGTGQLQTDIASERSSMDDRKAKQKEIIKQMSDERANLSTELNNIKMKLADFNNKLTICENDMNQKINEKNTFRNYVIEDSSALVLIKKRIEDIENQINNTELSAKDKEKLVQIDNKIAELEGQKENLNNHNQELIAQKDINNNQLQVATNKRTKEEGNIEKLRVQFENLTNRINEEYGLDYDSCLPYKLEDFDDSRSSTDLAHIKREINQLGEVTPSSIEEYEEVNKRYTELATERDDLLKAEEDLMGIVKDLSREMQEIFDTEFEKISKNFEITFKEIFGGGSGRLQIDPYAEDPLSAGIEIIASPPGKKTGNLSLLSGGEMALTAIAILFAILKSKPMPFCILDEIEAALDDGNAALFAKYLKKFVGNTQFIIITHRKPTMEQADRLFGVTMEERGVSKVVSVELAEAVKTIQ